MWAVRRASAPFGPPRFSRRSGGDDNPNIGSLLAAVNLASSSARKSWIAFLALTTYLMVALAGVKHRDLVLNNPVDLPFVKISIELDHFFVFAPIVFLIFHFGFLLQHVILSRTAQAFNARIEGGKETQSGFRLEVNPYFYSQVIAGPWANDVMKPILAAVVGATFVGFPIALLLFFQISFLPNHNSNITLLHQVFVLADCIAIALIGVILVRMRFNRPVRPLWRRVPRWAALTIIAMLVPAFSFCVATLPDSWMDRKMQAFGSVAVPLWDETPAHLRSPIVLHRRAFFLTAYLFEGAVDYLSGKTSGLFSRNLIVTDSVLRNEGAGNAEQVISIPGRDFRYATFDRSDLRRVNLNGSDLTGAKFVGANLSNASVSCAQKSGSFQQQSGCAIVRYADFGNAQLQNADFSYAFVQNARFQFAKMRNANFYFVHAEGSDFSWADLNGSNLAQSELTGVTFAYSSLIGANLISVSAAGASFERAQLFGAQFFLAKLQGADFQYAPLAGASFSEADMAAADLHGSVVWATVPPKFTEAADTQNARVVPITAATYGELLKKLEPVDVGGQKNGIQNALGILKPDAQNWSSAREQFNAGWQSIFAATAISDTAAYRKSVAVRLARLACGDGSSGAPFARGLIRRASNSTQNSNTGMEDILFDGDPDVFYDEMMKPGCKAIGNVPEKDISGLRRIAELYRSRRGK